VSDAACAFFGLVDSKEDTMAWTETTRLKYRGDGLRFASDTTDAEWALIEPFMPKPAGIGRPRSTNLRAVVDAILYILATGCQWRALGSDFPPRSMVQGYFYRWRGDGTWECINHHLLRQARQACRRKPTPLASSIAKPSRRRKAAAQALTPARRSRAESAKSLLIRKARC
jgi:putative transposase